MSDYLGNLIARTASLAVTVRPRLPSLFEPVPATGETVSWAEFEQKNFVEQPPVTGPSEKPAPMSLPMSILTPRQSVLRERRQAVPEISSVKKILKVTQESEPVLPATSTPESVRPRLSPRAAPTLREDEASNSARRMSDIIKSSPLDVVASASHAVRALEETARLQPASALESLALPKPGENEMPARSGVQAIIPTIRSLPSIASFPQSPATPVPTINVTIGRVEVRAVPPHVAVPKLATRAAPKLSLEEYLKQRNGSRS